MSKGSLGKTKIRVDAGKWLGHLPHNWTYIGYDEINYTYTPEGQRLTRTWARGVNTTYTRDPASGDLTLIDYSDSTPDVAFADYDLQGRAHTITDGLGTRTLSYATGGLLSGDSLTGVSYTYANGRVSGLSVGSYTVTYGYDAVECQCYRNNLSFEDERFARNRW